MKKHTVAVVLLSVVGCVFLSGCAAIVAGGLVGGATMMSVDRRTIGSQVSDTASEQRIGYELDQEIKEHHIVVTCYNHRVLLSGEVLTQEDKVLAGKIAQKSLEVTKVYNELAVREPVGWFTKIRDTNLANGIRMKIIGDADLSINQLKVVVNRGEVYLMGLVTAAESVKAAQIASHESGVKSVVKLFEKLTDEQVKQRMKLMEPPVTEEETQDKEVKIQ